MNFNSIKVRLERWLAGISPFAKAYFNSIKVRLELTAFLVISAIHRYFNSIKVRLEQSSYLRSTTSLSFQFHKGTIRTIMKIEAKQINEISIP